MSVKSSLAGGGGGGAAGGSGDVVGPAASTDNAVARFDGVTGKLLQNSDATLGDTAILQLGLSAGLGGKVKFGTTGAVIQASFNDRLQIRNAADSAAGELDVGTITSFSSMNLSTAKINIGSGGPFIHLSSDAAILGSSTTAYNGAKDWSISRIAAGVVGIGTGTAGTANGSLLSGRLVLPEITSPETIAVADSRKCITNTGAGGAVTYNLPAAAVGLEYYFAVTATQDMVIDAAGTDTIRIAAAVSAAGGTATNGAIGSTLHLCCVVSGQWFAIDAPNGIWTLSV